ncbi:hypothetical protein PMAYCL1PPCAC_18182 [Pristionchus mayeri]|uniref:Uncharacterized protein n=1 Tax=Pristionchus mayeri TaxID=1317129 RepID=A0AAN5CP45_9BILA|nr:hypothetical protein PMAYCL1PPCAC_18182 [Pristionchus mayeri]
MERNAHSAVCYEVEGIWNAHPRYATKTVMVKNNAVNGAFIVLKRMRLRYRSFTSYQAKSRTYSIAEWTATRGSVGDCRQL